VGFGNDLVTDCARRAECEDVLEAIPQLPHADAIAEMKRATCLLFQQAPWGTRRRLAEYLASRRPILAFPHYPDVMSERWLSERGGAKIAHTKTEIKAAIVSWYNEFLATGEPSISVDDDFIRQCSASHRASELNQLLNACLNGRQNCTDRRVLAEGESARAISPALSPIHSATIPLADSNGTFTTQVRRPSAAVECFTTASEGPRTVGVNAIGERYSIDVQPDAAAALDGVLATFRRERSLSETLDKLLAQSQPLRRLCVVDNEHTPENLDTINRVRQNHPGTQIIYLPTPENLGNAGAWALGMEHLLTDARDQDWIVILDDNNPPEGCDELRQLLEVGISAQRDDPSLGGVGISGAHFDWSSGLLQRVGDRELTGMIPVDYLAAGFLSMYCVRVIRSVGGVLPELFFGNVEIEYGLRMRRAGHALLAHGDLWLERRRLWNRCNTDPKPSAYCRVHWQRYYRIRNYIYMMRRFGRSDLAFKWAIIQCLAKPACSFFRSPSLGWRGLVQAALATRDGFTGRLGRTVEPDKGPPRRDWTLNGELLAQSPTPIHGENWT
jgi:GT2 family glycosyltransferase